MAEQDSWDIVSGRVGNLFNEGKEEEAWREIDRALASGELQNPEITGPTAGFREIGNRLYWNRRSLPAFVALQQEQERRLTAALAKAPDRAERSRLLRVLGGVHYKLASFTWPGWNEQGIEIGPLELEIGRHAAQQALSLKENPANDEIDFPYTVAMANWVVGAHALARGDWNAARLSFSREAACEREDGGDGLLGHGYSALVDLLERPEDDDVREAFEDVLQSLETSKVSDAKFYREQLKTALEVFGPSGSEFS